MKKGKVNSNSTQDSEDSCATKRSVEISNCIECPKRSGGYEANDKSTKAWCYLSGREIDNSINGYPAFCGLLKLEKEAEPFGVQSDVTVLRISDSEALNTKDCPLPLEVILNKMGINLCSVDFIKWEKQPDGQLTDLTIKFIPEDVEKNEQVNEIIKAHMKGDFAGDEK